MESKGLGDTIEKITKATGIKKVVDTISKATGKDCGCKTRKEKLNKAFPYKSLKSNKMAKKVNKIKAEELEIIQAAVNQVNQIQMQIGGIEAHKAQLLTAIKAAAEVVQAEQKKLEDIYGSVNIDLKTGEYTDVAADNKKD